MITTVLELAGALCVIAGVVLLLLPLIGVGWCVVLAGLLLVGLSAFVEYLHGAKGGAE